MVSSSLKHTLISKFVFYMLDTNILSKRIRIGISRSHILAIFILCLKYTPKISFLLENFKAGLDLKYLLQVRGSSTNWKFYEIMLEESEDIDAYITMPINARSCGLHIVHGGFKYGMVKTSCIGQADAPTRKHDYRKANARLGVLSAQVL